jgi:hypothetical protein
VHYLQAREDQKFMTRSTGEMPAPALIHIGLQLQLDPLDQQDRQEKTECTISN